MFKLKKKQYKLLKYTSTRNRNKNNYKINMSTIILKRFLDMQLYFLMGGWMGELLSILT